MFITRCRRNSDGPAWNYAQGGRDWPSLFQECGGSRQSPIYLPPRRPLEDMSLENSLPVLEMPFGRVPIKGDVSISKYSIGISVDSQDGLGASTLTGAGRLRLLAENAYSSSPPPTNSTIASNSEAATSRRLRTSSSSGSTKSGKRSEGKKGDDPHKRAPPTKSGPQPIPPNTPPVPPIPQEPSSPVPSSSLQPEPQDSERPQFVEDNWQVSRSLRSAIFLVPTT